MTYVVLALYFALLAFLGIYGIHRSSLLVRLRRSPLRLEPIVLLQEWPSITVQLPIFNERYVVERLIDAVCVLDYPRDKLEIQVLDDSTDETWEIVRRITARYRAAGMPIEHLSRETREGYKAGALDHGLKLARGEFIAIFDADFVPPADFLKRGVAPFLDAEVGMVQTRWEHLNRSYSTLTQIQAILLDGHFMIEHTARHAAGHFFNFNGTAGIWRRQAIEQAGGWQHDTLTEDLDLSYRAQLLGWKFVYRPDIQSPAELPVDINAFKSQQRRWAKGSIQTGIKLLPTILRSNLPRGVKSDAFFHLTANLCYLAIPLLALLMPIATIVRGEHSGLFLLMIDGPLFLLSLASTTTFYLDAQRHLPLTLSQRLKSLPLVLAIGIGISLSNAVAVLEGLLGIRSSFIRTPKHGVRDENDRPHGYFSSAGGYPVMELALAAYLLGGTGYAWHEGFYFSTPFMLLFFYGFACVGFASLRTPPSIPTLALSSTAPIESAE